MTTAKNQSTFLNFQNLLKLSHSNFLLQASVFYSAYISSFSLQFFSFIHIISTAMIQLQLHLFGEKVKFFI